MQPNYNKMEEKKKLSEETIFAVEEALGKSEAFILKNQKIIGIVIGAIVVIVLGVIGYKKFIQQPREKLAQSQMFMAQKYFGMDSLKLAVNGDGNYPGFIKITEDYGSTKAGNLAHYYLGICYLKQGKFDDAITQLKKFDSDDHYVQAMANGGIGDAYLELNDLKEAAKYYEKAAKMKDNDITTPLYLKRLAFVYEQSGDYDKALAAYEKIQKEHFKSYEGREIDKYIARVKGLMGKK